MSLSEVPIRHETYEGVPATFIHTREIMTVSGFLLLVLTGVIVIALSCTLDRLWAVAMPVRAVYLFIRLPGVVLHECSHIIGCLLTGAQIRNIVLFSEDGGSVTYCRPRLPYIGDVIISSAPLFLLPLALSLITWVFGSYLGCIFPVYPALVGSSDALSGIGMAVFGTFSDNLLARFNGWFLLYLYLTVSLVLSVAPSTQDMKNAAAGSILLVLAGILIVSSGIPRAVSLLDELVRLLGYGFTLGLVYGLVALLVSLPLLFWYAYKHRS
jgi:Putative zincin peptidase